MALIKAGRPIHNHGSVTDSVIGIGYDREYVKKASQMHLSLISCMLCVVILQKNMGREIQLIGGVLAWATLGKKIDLVRIVWCSEMDATRTADTLSTRQSVIC